MYLIFCIKSLSLSSNMFNNAHPLPPWQTLGNTIHLHRDYQGQILSL
jgi:hypothetical protein